MKCRYDLMKPSETRDRKGDYYPDVLSLDLKDVEFDTPLTPVTVTQRIVKRPYLLTFDEYELCYYDDLVYWLNGVSYVEELEVGEELMVPSLNDIKKFYTDRYVSEE